MIVCRFCLDRWDSWDDVPEGRENGRTVRLCPSCRTAAYLTASYRVKRETEED